MYVYIYIYIFIYAPILLVTTMALGYDKIEKQKLSAHR